MPPYSADGTRKQRNGDPAATLTTREVTYIKLVCRKPEPSRAEVAEQMGVSKDTVDRFCEAAYSKLDVHTKVELYIEAVRIGLVKCSCDPAREREMGSGQDAQVP